MDDDTLSIYGWKWDLSTRGVGYEKRYGVYCVLVTF